jgi:hypothetical protein
MMHITPLDQGLSGNAVELSGWRAALGCTAFHLSLAQHVHQFDASDGALGRVMSFEAEHGTDHPLHGPMVLFHHIITLLR